MAELKTTVKSPKGPIFEFEGRHPAPELFEKTAKELRATIQKAEEHLAEISRWETTCSRGKVKARTYEEIHRA